MKDKKGFVSFCNTVPPQMSVAHHRGECFNWGDLRAQVSHLAAAIPQNVARIAVTDEDAYPFLIALLATLAAGRTAVLLPNAAPAYLDAHAGLFDLVLAGTDFVKTLEGRTHIQALDFTPEHAGTDCTLQFPENAPAIELYTSGSTGEPKRVAKSLANMFDEACLLLPRFFGLKLGFLQHGWELAAAGSVYPRHMYGLTFRIFVPLVALIPIYSEIMLFTEEFCAAKEHVIFVTSPAFMRRADFELKAPETLLAVSAGGALPVEAAKKFSSWTGAPILEIYGSTESGVIALRIAGKEEQLWEMLPGVAIDTASGQAILHTPLISQDKLELSDRIVIHDAKHFRLEGRTDDIVKLEDKRVSLRAVENALKAIPEITDAACIAVQSKGRLIIAAAVVLRDAAVADEYARAPLAVRRRWRGTLEQELDPLAVPRRYAVLDAIPENSMGKRRRADLIKLFETHDD